MLLWGGLAPPGMSYGEMPRCGWWRVAQRNSENLVVRDLINTVSDVT